MTIKLWHKKKQQEEIYTNIALIEHCLLRNTDNDTAIEALLLTYEEHDQETIMVSLDEFCVDEISQYNIAATYFE